MVEGRTGLGRRTVARRASFACGNRGILLRVMDRAAPFEGTGLLADHPDTLPDDDPPGVGMHLCRTFDARGQDGKRVIGPCNSSTRTHAGEAIDMNDEVGRLGRGRPPIVLSASSTWRRALGLTCASDTHRCSGQGFKSSKLLTRRRGVKNPRRTSPT